ncbi:MAG: aminomethyl transferase family protein [Acidimicrobiia bacterium]|nr:aminomethyl transferase family protein [Acidimicrobiia bacterium]
MGSTEKALLAAEHGVVAFDLSHLEHTLYEVLPDAISDTITRDIGSLEEGFCTEGLILDADATITQHLDIWRSQRIFMYRRSPASAVGSHVLVALIGPNSASAVAAILGVLPQSGMVFATDWHGARILFAGNGPSYGRTATLAIPVDVASEVFSALMAEGVSPGGLEAFDALRTEGGELNWGSDALPSLTPLEADLSHLVDPEAAFTGRRAYRRAMRKGNERVVVGFKTNSCSPEPGSGLRAGSASGSVISVMKWPKSSDTVGLGWLEPAPVFHRGSKAFGDPLPQLEANVGGSWFPVSLTDPPFTREA